MLIFAGFLITKNNSGNGCNETGYNLILSGLFVSIFSIITLYLYIFAMNMRKVALFRGYLSFLESQWNAIAGSKIMLFDSQIIDKFFSLRVFLVNGLGPVVMILFLVISAVLGFGLSFYFTYRLQNLTVKRGMGLLICVLGIVCIFYSGICCYYLATNDFAAKAVLEDCQAELQLK